MSYHKLTRLNKPLISISTLPFILRQILSHFQDNFVTNKNTMWNTGQQPRMENSHLVLNSNYELRFMYWSRCVHGRNLIFSSKQWQKCSFKSAYEWWQRQKSMQIFVLICSPVKSSLSIWICSWYSLLWIIIQSILFKRTHRPALNVCTKVGNILSEHSTITLILLAHLFSTN